MEVLKTQSLDGLDLFDNLFEFDLIINSFYLLLSFLDDYMDYSKLLCHSLFNSIII